MFSGLIFELLLSLLPNLISLMLAAFVDGGASTTAT
jgi:hypothetical protein